jgi:hypothetical protein
MTMAERSSGEARCAAPQPPVLRVLFVSIINSVGSERAVAAMGRLGVECAVLSPTDSYPSLTRFAARRFCLPPYRGIRRLGLLTARHRLESAVLDFRPDRVVPLDDLSAKFLCGIALDSSASRPSRTVLVASLGSPEGFADTCDRRRGMDLAARLGLRTPGHRAVRNAVAARELAAAWGYPVVLKREHSGGGDGVAIARDPMQLDAAFEAVQARDGRWTKQAARVGRRLLWRWAGLPFSPDAPPLLQRHVNGAPAMHTLAASEGRVLEGVSFLAEHTHPGPTGPSTVVRHIENPEMADTAARLVAALDCSGIVSFDFVLEAGGSDAYLVEVNPRPIAAACLGSLFGHDVYGAWMAHLRGLPAPPRAPAAETRPVALFPQELVRDPRGLRQRLGTGEVLHDAPWDDPVVVEAYTRYLARIHPAQAESVRQLLSRGRGAHDQR